MVWNIGGEGTEEDALFPQPIRTSFFQPLDSISLTHILESLSFYLFFSFFNLFIYFMLRSTSCILFLGLLWGKNLHLFSLIHPPCPSILSTFFFNLLLIFLELFIYLFMKNNIWWWYEYSQKKFRRQNGMHNKILKISKLIIKFVIFDH